MPPRPPPPSPTDLRKALRAGKGRRPKRVAVILATAANVLSGGTVRVKAALQRLMPGVAFPRLAQMQGRWMPQILLFGHVYDSARPGRKRAADHIPEETALLAAAEATSTYETGAGPERIRDASDAARFCPSFEAAMAACAPHHISRPETVLRGVAEATGVDIRSRRVRQWQGTGHENEYARGVAACRNLELFTSFREEDEPQEADSPPRKPIRILPKLYTLVQIDSKKLWVTETLHHRTVLCGPEDPAVYSGLDDDRLRSAAKTSINYYIAVSPLVGVLALVFVSGTTSLETRYQVSPYSSPCASCCAQASGPCRPWPGMLAR